MQRDTSSTQLQRVNQRRRGRKTRTLPAYKLARQRREQEAAWKAIDDQFVKLGRLADQLIDANRDLQVRVALRSIDPSEQEQRLAAAVNTTRDLAAQGILAVLGRDPL